MQTLEYLDYSPTFGIKMRILRPDFTHRKDLGIEYTIAAGVTGPLEHYHPTLTETFEVLSGQLEIKVDGKWQGLVPGIQLAVKPFHKHTFRNSSSEDVVIMTWIEPHGGFADFFTDLWYLVRTGQYRSQWSLKFIAQYALLEKKHKKDFLSVQPFRFALRSLALLVSILGFRLPTFPTPEEVEKAQGNNA